MSIGFERTQFDQSLTCIRIKTQGYFPVWKTLKENGARGRQLRHWLFDFEGVTWFFFVIYHVYIYIYIYLSCKIQMDIRQDGQQSVKKKKKNWTKVKRD